MTIHLVTDSTSDLLPAQAETLRVHVVPLTVRFGDEQFRDGVDLSAEAFYRRLQSDSVSPTTSQPSPQQFTDVFAGCLSSPGDQVVSVHISQKLSGTLQSATLAARELGNERVRTVDGETVSVGLQILLAGARRDIDGGADLDTVVSNLEDRRRRMSVQVLLDTLTYLQRGGRIGRAQAFVGGMLKFKPVLTLRDGEVHPETRVRSRSQGIEELLTRVRSQLPLESIGAMHADAPALLDVIRERVAGDCPELTLATGQLGPVVGTYTGPGAIGVACLRAG